jgi:hypothetical protein
MCCDGKAALNRCFSRNTDMNSPHWDIINLAISERTSSLITWRQQHVKGHQNHFPLERDAMLNDEMDQRCKKFWEEGSIAPLWFHQKWTVTVDKQQVVSDLTTSIRRSCANMRAIKYWQLKLGSKQEEIDWTSLGHAIKKVPRSRSQWLTKHMSGFCSVGLFAKKIGLRPSDECPRCGESESVEHVWRCGNSDTTKLWNAQLGALKKLLRQLQTDPKITKVIVEGLNGWRQGEEKRYNSRFAAEQVADCQTESGWKHFFEGRLHKEWRILQEKYFLRLAIRRSGKRWSGAIVQKLWDIAWDLWEQRNGVLHGKNCALLTLEIDKKIKELWDDPDRTKITTIKKMKPNSAEALLQSTLATKQNWVTRVEMALLRFKASQDEFKFAAEREQMRKYLLGFK